MWALAGAGFRAWIAPSYGDIFFENSFKNGVLAIVLPIERFDVDPFRKECLMAGID